MIPYYKGRRLPKVLVEHVTGNGVREITPVQSLHFANHSPTGFEWGYAGSGPAQLALAILLDCLWLKDLAYRELALRYYQDFKDRFVSGWGEDWSIDENEIVNWLELQRAKSE